MGTAELPRITGTELELCILLPDEKGNFTPPTGTVPTEILRDGMPSYLGRAANGHFSNYFTTNGSRIYRDVNDHLEYATPEDDSLWGTVANEIALEKVMGDTLEEYTQAKGVPDYRMHKRVIDKHGTTWGYHENYYMPRATTLPSHDQFVPLALHLATRQIFTGAGYQRGDGAFRVSQKMNEIFVDISRDTTHSKPLINQRDQPHTGGNKNLGRRLHITSGDPNMSPWATFMKLATTSIVLRLVEEDRTSFSDLEPRLSLHGIAGIFCGDTTLRRTVEIQSGKRYSALDIQEILLEESEAFAKRRGLPDEEAQALSMWQDVLGDLRKDPTLAMDRVDWIAKHIAIQRFAAKHGLKPNDEQLQAIDGRWDLIGDQGVSKKLRQTRWQPWTDNELARDRVYNPPFTTRAFPRSLFVSMVDGMDKVTIDWDRVTIKNRSRLLSNPRNNDTRSIESLFPVQRAS